jgi:hypothetical protein
MCRDASLNLTLVIPTNPAVRPRIAITHFPRFLRVFSTKEKLRKRTRELPFSIEPLTAGKSDIYPSFLGEIQAKIPKKHVSKTSTINPGKTSRTQAFSCSNKTDLTRRHSPRDICDTVLINAGIGFYDKNRPGKNVSEFFLSGRKIPGTAWSPRGLAPKGQAKHNSAQAPNHTYPWPSSICAFIGIRPTLHPRHAPEIEKTGQPVTLSFLSAFTGVHRRPERFFMPPTRVACTAEVHTTLHNPAQPPTARHSRPSVTNPRPDQAQFCTSSQARYPWPQSIPFGIRPARLTRAQPPRKIEKTGEPVTSPKVRRRFALPATTSRERKSPKSTNLSPSRRPVQPTVSSFVFIRVHSWPDRFFPAFPRSSPHEARTTRPNHSTARLPRPPATTPHPTQFCTSSQSRRSVAPSNCQLLRPFAAGAFSSEFARNRGTCHRPHGPQESTAELSLGGWPPRTVAPLKSATTLPSPRATFSLHCLQCPASTH